VKISVITPTLNQLQFLKRTARSVLGQQGPFDLEWIIIDGGSDDGTIEYLRLLEDPRLRWSSAKDRGQADAINRGITLATGEIVAWLNSDDLYTPSALQMVARAFYDRPESKWLVGRCEIIDADDRVIRTAITRYKDSLLDRYSYRRLLRENAISQPAVFWRRAFGQEAGPLDQSLHYAMDYDLWLRMARLSEPLILEKVLAQFRFHPTSKSGQVQRAQFDEGYRVAKRYFNGDWRSQLAHRMHVAKIVWAYRVMRVLGM
jgi:glycosyltransferase involved in cell wall biosynthesis